MSVRLGKSTSQTQSGEASSSTTTESELAPARGQKIMRTTAMNRFKVGDEAREMSADDDA